MYLVSTDRYEVPSHAKRARLLFCFSHQFFLFSHLGIVSLPSKSIWAIKLSVAAVVAPPVLGAHYTALMQMLFVGKI
jgi:hypothetical protein